MTENSNKPQNDSPGTQRTLVGEFLPPKEPLSYDLDKRNIERLKRILSILRTVLAYEVPNRHSLIAHLMSFWTLSRQTILADLRSLEDGGYLKRNGRIEAITPSGIAYIKTIEGLLEKVKE